jgi:hypothetical protein
LKALADSGNFLISEIPANWVYLTEGGEAKVYLHPDQLSVIKRNDAAYVSPDGSWYFLECNPAGQFLWLED